MTIPTEIAKAIAQRADVCPATVQRFLRGDEVRPSSRRRILRAMRSVGLESALGLGLSRLDAPMRARPE